MTPASDISILSLALALGAGLLSFVSPCVLPLVPAYVGYIAGTSIADLRDHGPKQRGGTLALTLAFVAGLAVVFTLLGATATTAGRLLGQYQPLITKLAGLLVIAFGLHMAGIIRIPWLYVTRQADVARYRGRGALGAALMGAAFATGWVPCVGPFLASILTLASQEPTADRGMLLLFTYGLGLGIPFIVVSLLWEPALRWMRWIQPRLGVIEIMSGLLLVVLGALLFTDQYSFLASRLTELFGIGLAV